jgi:hypothetical protein
VQQQLSCSHLSSGSFSGSFIGSGSLFGSGKWTSMNAADLAGKCFD